MEKSDGFVFAKVSCLCMFIVVICRGGRGRGGGGRNVRERKVVERGEEREGEEVGMGKKGRNVHVG